MKAHTRRRPDRGSDPTHTSDRQPRQPGEAPPDLSLVEPDAGSTTPLLDAAGLDDFVGPPRMYVVQRGDTLERIARYYGTTVDTLIQLNHIRDANRIQAGQTLLVPESGRASGPGSAPSERELTCVVERGDSLWALARRYGTTIDALVDLNGIRDANQIRVGQVLRIPGSRTGTGQAPPQAPQTQAPPTQAPPTQAPQTQAPPTQAPQTQAPQTQAPQTQAPQTQAGADPQGLQLAANAALELVSRDQRAYAASAIPSILGQCVATNQRNVDQVAYILATAEHESRFGKPLYSRSESLVEDHNPYRQGADGTWSARVHTSGRTATGATEQELDEHYWDDAYGGRLANEKGTSDAADFRGRGFVQLTGRTNYDKMTQRLNREGFTYTHDNVQYGGPGNAPLDLVANPTHVNLVPELAARILVLGSAEGLFTGRSLGDYIGEDGADFYNARAVINGDKEKNGYTIAQRAQAYAAALRPFWAGLFPAS